MRTSRKKLVQVSVAIREFRQQAQLSQDELADRMDMSTPYISMLESGKRYPSIEMLIRIAIALEVRPGAMLDRIAEGYISGNALHAPD
jgi:transcriptional regulator with XRE-family HTH domain